MLYVGTLVNGRTLSSGIVPVPCSFLGCAFEAFEEFSARIRSRMNFPSAKLAPADLRLGLMGQSPPCCRRWGRNNIDSGTHFILVSLHLCAFLFPCVRAEAGQKTPRRARICSAFNRNGLLLPSISSSSFQIDSKLKFFCVGNVSAEHLTLDNTQAHAESRTLIWTSSRVLLSRRLCEKKDET